MFTKKQLVFTLLGWLLLCYAVSAVGAAASVNAGSFYRDLTQPSWSPPSWVFGPVWSLLYTMIGVSAWMVWRRGGFTRNKKVLALFIAHLIPNALWSWLFFNWKMGTGALIDIAILWVMIITLVLLFYKKSRIAAALLLPYLMWVTFAAVLNLNLLLNNQSAL